MHLWRWGADEFVIEMPFPLPSKFFKGFPVYLRVGEGATHHKTQPYEGGVGCEHFDVVGERLEVEKPGPASRCHRTCDS